MWSAVYRRCGICVTDRVRRIHWTMGRPMRRYIARHSFGWAIVLCFVAIVVICGGCAAGTGDLRAPTDRAFVEKIKRRCGLVYTPPRPRGEALGFVCGSSADTPAHFAAMFT